MCPKKAKSLKQRVRLYHRERLEKWFKEVAKDAEKASDKNTINTASTVAKHGKEKGSSKGKSVRQ